jgi:hypothetical protein
MAGECVGTWRLIARSNTRSAARRKPINETRKFGKRGEDDARRNAERNMGSIPAGNVYLCETAKPRQKSDRNQTIFGKAQRRAGFGPSNRFAASERTRTAAATRLKAIYGVLRARTP